MAVQVVEVELGGVADLPPVVLVRVAAVEDHVGAHQGGGVEGHLWRQQLLVPSCCGSLTRVEDLSPALGLQLKQEDLVAELAGKG